jgi:hypothetical protein
VGFGNVAAAGMAGLLVRFEAVVFGVNQTVRPC